MDDPADGLTVVGEQTLFARALDASRELTLVTNETSDATPGGPTSLVSTYMQNAESSIKNPLVDVKGLEPLTFRV